MRKQPGSHLQWGYSALLMNCCGKKIQTPDMDLKVESPVSSPLNHDSPSSSHLNYLQELQATFLKEELHNRFNLISGERVKIFKHNSENLMKIGWKIRKLWHFEVSQIFTKHFLTSRYEYANEWVDDVITSLLAIMLYIKFLKILIFCPNLW